MLGHPINPPKYPYANKYEEKYCQLIIDIMSEGDDLDSVAAACNISKKTLYNWRDAHPEFAEAWEIGLAKYIHWWKKLGKDYIITVPPDIKFDTALYMINMRNRCGWRATDPKEEPDDNKSQAQLLADAMIIANKALKEVEGMNSEQ